MLSNWILWAIRFHWVISAPTEFDLKQFVSLSHFRLTEPLLSHLAIYLCIQIWMNFQLLETSNVIAMLSHFFIASPYVFIEKWRAGTPIISPSYCCHCRRKVLFSTTCFELWYLWAVCYWIDADEKSSPIWALGWVDFSRLVNFHKLPSI